MHKASNIIYGTVWRPHQCVSKERKMRPLNDDEKLSQNRPSFGKFYGASEDDYEITWTASHRTNTRWSFHTAKGYGFAFTNQTLFMEMCPVGPQDIAMSNEDYEYAKALSMIVQRNRDYEIMEKNLVEGIFRIWGAMMECYDENLMLYIRFWVGAYKLERHESIYFENPDFDPTLLECLPYSIEHNMFIAQNFYGEIPWNYIETLALNHDIDEPIPLEVSCMVMTEALQESWLFLDNVHRLIGILIREKLRRKRSAPPSVTDHQSIVNPYSTKQGYKDPWGSYIFYAKNLKKIHGTFNYEEHAEISKDGVNWESEFPVDIDMNTVKAYRKVYVKCDVMPDNIVKFASSLNVLGQRINIEMILSKTEINYRDLGKENISRLYIHSFRTMHPLHDSLNDAAFRYQRQLIDGLTKKAYDYVCESYIECPLLPEEGLPIQFRVLDIFTNDSDDKDGIVNNPVDVTVIICWEVEDVYKKAEEEWDEKWEEEQRLAKIYYEKHKNKDQEEKPRMGRMSLDDFKSENPEEYKKLIDSMSGVNVQVEGDGEIPSEGEETAIVPH